MESEQKQQSLRNLIFRYQHLTFEVFSVETIRGSRNQAKRVDLFFFSLAIMLSHPWLTPSCRSQLKHPFLGKVFPDSVRSVFPSLFHYPIITALLTLSLVMHQYLALTKHPVAFKWPSPFLCVHTHTSPS